MVWIVGFHLRVIEIYQADQGRFGCRRLQPVAGKAFAVQ